MSGVELVLAQLDIRSRRGGTCVSEDGFCPGWIVDNLDRYVDPLAQHVFLTVVSIAIGFAISFALALLAHRRQWLKPPISAFTSVLFTIPSVAAFLLLLPVTGRTSLTAIIALVAYTQVFLFRNAVNGLGNVPEETRDAARGMGLTDREILWRVELPLAVPSIIAGLRIATVTVISLATVAAFIVNEGLGAPIFDAIQQNVFKTEIYAAGGLAIALALGADALLVLAQRLATPGARHGRPA